MTTKAVKESCAGLTDEQVTGMIEVLSKFLAEYVKEWQKRQLERQAVTA